MITEIFVTLCNYSLYLKIKLRKIVLKKRERIRDNKDHRGLLWSYHDVVNGNILRKMLMKDFLFLFLPISRRDRQSFS